MKPHHLILVPPERLSPLLAPSDWGGLPPVAVEWGITEAGLLSYTGGQTWFHARTSLPGHPTVLRRGLVLASEGEPLADGLDRLWRTFPSVFNPTSGRTFVFAALRGGSQAVHLDDHVLIFLDGNKHEIVKCIDCQEWKLKSETALLPDPDGPQYTCLPCRDHFCKKCGHEFDSEDHELECIEEVFG
jgi:hypothetical protein